MSQFVVKYDCVKCWPNTRVNAVVCAIFDDFREPIYNNLCFNAVKSKPRNYLCKCTKEVWATKEDCLLQSLLHLLIFKTFYLGLRIPIFGSLIMICNSRLILVLLLSLFLTHFGICSNYIHHLFWFRFNRFWKEQKRLKIFSFAKPLNN